MIDPYESVIDADCMVLCTEPNVHGDMAAFTGTTIIWGFIKNSVDVISCKPDPCNIFENVFHFIYMHHGCSVGFPNIDLQKYLPNCILVLSRVLARYEKVCCVWG